MLNSPILDCQGLRYRYPGSQHSFTFNFQIPKPEFVGIIGKSGSGKSTLLSLLAGFLTPKQGQIKIHQQDITQVPPHKRDIAFLFQSHNLFYHLTVFQNVALGISSKLKLSKEEKEFILSTLEELYIAELAHQKVQALSGGQQQRVGIARCLVQQKAFLLLDEPFSSLEPRLRQSLLQLVTQKARAQQQTILMVTHLPEEFEGIVERTLTLELNEIGSTLISLT